MSKMSSQLSPVSEVQATAQWTRLGVLFNVAPAQQTPDLERLLLDTVRLTHNNLRLFIMAATWLVQYGDYVAKRRLAVLIRHELPTPYQPIMGLLLNWVQLHTHRKENRFQEALRQCQPNPNPQPLLALHHKNAAFFQHAQQTASPLSRKWGYWIEDLEFKPNALRTLDWITQHNPSLALRAITGGDLVATIAAEAHWGQAEFPSESYLAQYYGASRA